MNYYPFHIGDYLSATRHLSWVEDAAYRRLLDTYYITEKPLPADLRAVCRLVLAATEEQREAVEIVLKEFFFLTDFGWINERADAEIHAMAERQQKARDKANKRWHKPKQERSNASAMLQHEEEDAAASKTDADAMLPTPTPTPKDKDKRVPRFDAYRHLVSMGVDEKVASDWLAHRRAKKAVPTETAISGIQREADKAGVSLQAALELSCQRGWIGFKADWIANQVRASPMSARERQDAAMLKAIGMVPSQNQGFLLEVRDEKIA